MPCFANIFLLFAKDELEVGGRWPSDEVCQVLGVVNPEGEHLLKVGDERLQGRRQLGVETLIQEGQVNQAVVEDDGLLLRNKQAHQLSQALVSTFRGILDEKLLESEDY